MEETQIQNTPQIQNDLQIQNDPQIQNDSQIQNNPQIQNDSQIQESYDFGLDKFVLNEMHRTASSHSVFAANLLERIFNKIELINSNVNGRSKFGKENDDKLPLNPVKIAFIKATCKKMYNYQDEKKFWRACIHEMNRRVAKINKNN